MLTIRTLVGFAGKAKANALAAENLERVPITRTSLPLRITIIFDEDTDESANAYQAHNDPVDTGSDDGEEALDNDDDEENDTFSSYVVLDDVTVFEAAELDAIALLADTSNDDLDPEVSAQLVQASAPAHLSFGKEKGKGKGKAKGKGKGRYPVRPVTSVTGRPTKTARLHKKTRRVQLDWRHDKTSYQPSESSWSVFRSQRMP